MPSITIPNIIPESNLPNNKKMLNLRVGKVLINIKIDFLLNLNINILHLFRMKNQELRVLYLQEI